MTKEEIMELDSDQLEQRMEEISSLVETAEDETKVEELSAEVEMIEERKAAIVEQRKADVDAVLNDEGETTSIKVEEETFTMDIKEIRSSSAYVDAFANYIKTGDDKECRALLTEQVSTGVVPVPTFVEETIRTAWNDNKILAKVKKSYIKGILKVGFEISADGAVVHTEGAAAPSEEKLVLGIVELKPASIKKWITISDEAIDLTGEAFLKYVYDELSYQIAKKAEDELIAKIKACGTVSTNTATTNVAVPAIAVATATLSTIAEAISQLSDRATNPVVMINKASYATFKALQYAGNYAVDPFEGCEVLFNDTIASYTAATSGVCYAIVGDLGVGAQANFPNGEEITIKYDDLSLAESDLVKIVGREYVGMGVVAPNAFCQIKKPV